MFLESIVYLAAVHRPHHVSRSETRAEVVSAPFKALAECESSGRWNVVNPPYYGAYQFDVQTWASVGGHGLPSDASPAEQTARAERLYHERGTTPWPVCGHWLRDAA